VRQARSKKQEARSKKQEARSKNIRDAVRGHYPHDSAG
jgi:hypothetical protein